MPSKKFFHWLSEFTGGSGETTAIPGELPDLRLFMNLVDELNDAIFIINPARGEFLYVNARAAANLGYNREELLRMRTYEIEADLPDEASWQQHVALLRKESTLFFQGHHKRKDGSAFPVEVNVKHLPVNGKEYLVAIARDITERKADEAKLIEERNKLDAVLAGMGDGLTVQDTGFRILYQNSIHQKKQGSHLGEYCYKAYHGREQVCEGCLLVKSFRDGEVHRREVSAITPEGVIHMEVSASPVLNRDGKIIAGVEIVRDITEQKSLERQFLQAQKMEAIGRLTGGIAHDFNNLLSVILGYSDLVLMNLSKDHHLRENIETIRDAGLRATRLTRQLLAFSRKQVMEMKRLSLSRFIEDMGNILKGLIGEDIELRLHITPGIGDITGDQNQLEQIVMNLMVNARDSMPSGGIVTINTDEVEFDEPFLRRHEGSKPGTYVRLMVSDTGEGIENSIRGHIFDPFFTTKKIGKGTGLGLSTVYGIVKQHGGYIYVDSEPGAGTTFSVFFPLESGSAERVAETRAEPGQGGAETILVVDDEPQVRRVLLDILGAQGYTLLEAGSGAEALELFTKSGQDVDLLLSDVIMPRTNGRQLAEQLLALKPGLKVLFMSGYSDEMIADKGVLEAGMNFLEKPFDSEILLGKIREVLDG